MYWYRILEVPVSRGLLGRVVNTLGAPIDGKGPLEHDGFSAVEAIAPGVIERQSVDQPVQTGYKSVDAMIPIGRGQRELIIGDRQTGKTALAIDAIINQRDSGIKCVYVAIGTRKRPRFLTWYVNWKNTARWLTPSLWLQPHLNLPHCNTWRRMPVVQWVNTSATAVKMR